MNLDFYRLNEQPFEACPDPRFLYMSGSHRQALAALLQALQAGRGFVTLLAKPGLGKTTLLFHTIHSFGDKVATVYILQAAQSPIDLLRVILADLGVRDVNENSEEMLLRLREVLIEEHRLGKRVIVVIDEAQHLDASVFDFLYTLANQETDRGRLIQFILCGQPRLSEKLAAVKPPLAMQHGTVVRLQPFSAQDTAQYVDHRLRTAGYSRPSPLFTPDAAALVARYSEGNPRSINSLCSEALYAGSKDKREQVGAEIVRGAAATLEMNKPMQEGRSALLPAVFIGPPVPANADIGPLRPQAVARRQTPRSEPVAATAVGPISPSEGKDEEGVVPREAAAAEARGEQKSLQELALPTPTERPALSTTVNSGSAVAQAAEQHTLPQLKPHKEAVVVPYPAPFLAEGRVKPTGPPEKALPAPAQPASAKVLNPKSEVAASTDWQATGLGMPQRPSQEKRAPAFALPAAPPAILRKELIRERASSRSAQLLWSPSRLRKSWIALRSNSSYPLKGLAIAAVFLAVVGAVFGVYRADTFHPPVRQIQPASPVLPSAPIVQPQNEGAIHSMASKAAPESPAHNLKGMDVATALQALAARAQRQQQDQPGDAAP